ncbi:type VII secretion integral membrane protein EccD [Streptomyces silvensis]|uniref:Type VII secretion integral membrane protein EccD n=1 Tax=Streptomyces silvensis TaxID=1765722 RepID=A0A0W7WR32_9ACTN|nr:type VII secretion integral membrane protein EccD [Streptomyces silvensis]KUF13014.1 type VII secretion integral membrane protein EccD [Streptomyces silvensis]
MSRSQGHGQGRVALSRVTLVGERRRVDLVLPSQEPVGLLLPEVMRLLDDRVGARPELRYLVAADGSALAQDSSLESAGVADGAVLRLVRAEDAPSAPVVHDVTDEAAGDLDVRAWRWSEGSRRAVCGAAAVGWALAAAALARGEFDDSRAGAALLLVAAVAALGGALLGRAGRRGLATTLVSVAGALGVFGVWIAGHAHGWSGPAQLAGVGGVLVVALLLLGWFTPLGRGGIVGGCALAACGIAWEAVLGLQDGGQHLDRVGAVLAVVSVVVLGVLPRLALMASGLSGLDDRRSGGASVSRYEVGSALAATHRGLALATVALAVSAGAAGVLALREVTVWSVLLAADAALVLALRARAFPLVAEVVVLLAAAASVTARLAWVWLGQGDATTGPLALLVVLALAPLLVLAVRPAEHVRVRLRRIGDGLESLGVIALVPLALGVFGVYGRLLDTFA